MEEYWIGKNIDVDRTWRDSEEGEGYIAKYRSTEMGHIEVVFDNFSKGDAIFNFEAVFKSFKSALHDFKRGVYSRTDYDSLVVSNTRYSHHRHLPKTDGFQFTNLTSNELQGYLSEIH